MRGALLARQVNRVGRGRIAARRIEPPLAVARSYCPVVVLSLLREEVPPLDPTDAQPLGSSAGSLPALGMATCPARYPPVPGGPARGFLSRTLGFRPLAVGCSSIAIGDVTCQVVVKHFLLAQARQDSNLEPLALEASALPIAPRTLPESPTGGGTTFPRISTGLRRAWSSRNGSFAVVKDDSSS